MSQPAGSALAPLPFELVYSDGEPLESNWHVNQITLFKESVQQAMKERSRTDYFVAGNMFVYYSLEQAQAIAADINDRQHYRGPDIFYVGGVDGRNDRNAWVAWEEGGRYPEVIVELLSHTTATKDRTTKKDLYAHVFRTPEYFLQDPDEVKLEGFRLMGETYWPIVPNAERRLWSERLGLDLGLWQGTFQEQTAIWVRLYHPNGRLVLTGSEKGEVERQRADAAEAELARLRARLDDASRDRPRTGR